MNGASNKLFAGSGLAGDKDGRVGGSNLFYAEQDPLNRIAAADDLVEVVFKFDLFLQVGVVSLELVLQLIHLFKQQRQSFF